MELLQLPQSWHCSHQIEDGNDEPFTGVIEKPFVYPSAESVSRIRRPVWDLSPRRHEEQEGEDDDYAWYYRHPERYIWRPRRRRLIKSSRQKDEQFNVFNFLLNISRVSWTDASISETQHSETWSLLSSSTGSTKTSDVGFLKN